MAAATVSVLIVDDQALFRRAAKAVLEATPGFEVVGEAESGEEGVALVASFAPALVLMDIKMPGVDGIETTRRMLAARPKTVVVLLSTYEARDLPDDASACGAAAYVHKEEFGPEVLEDVWRRSGAGNQLARVVVLASHSPNNPGPATPKSVKA